MWNCTQNSWTRWLLGCANWGNWLRQLMNTKTYQLLLAMSDVDRWPRLDQGPSGVVFLLEWRTCVNGNVDDAIADHPGKNCELYWPEFEWSVSHIFERDERQTSLMNTHGKYWDAPSLPSRGEAIHYWIHRYGDGWTDVINEGQIVHRRPSTLRIWIWGMS